MYLREDKGASGSMRVTMEDICENLKSKMETLEGLQGGLQKLIAYLKVIQGWRNTRPWGYKTFVHAKLNWAQNFNCS